MAEADEDESDLDLAWKMLDVARAIAEKQHVGDTLEKVDVLAALAEVALERGWLLVDFNYDLIFPPMWKLLLPFYLC